MYHERNNHTRERFMTRNASTIPEQLPEWVQPMERRAGVIAVDIPVYIALLLHRIPLPGAD
jgi:hypothetical protein